MSIGTMDEFISAHLRWCRNRNLADRTIEERRRVLEQVNRDLPFGVEQATEDELRDWLDRPGWKPATRVAYWIHLRGTYRWACGGRSPILDFDPMEEIERPKRPKGYARPVPLDLANRLAVELPEPWNTFTLLARAMGLRCCEMGRLHRDHIAPPPGNTRLHGAKGGSVQEIPTHPAVWERVKPLSGWIAEAVGGRADGRWISIHSSNWFRGHGHAGLSLHRWRHLFACEVRKSGNDLRATQRAMRHASITSTEIYTEVGNEELHRAVTSLPIPTPEAQEEPES